MIIGWPIVSALKRLRSAGRCQGSPLSMPIDRLAAIAEMSEIRGVFGMVRRRSAP